MHCQPDLGSFKCIEHFYGSVSTDRAHEILQSVATDLRWSLVKTENALCELWRRINLDSKIPVDFYFPGQRFVEYTPQIFLVIEVTEGLTRQECNDFASMGIGQTPHPARHCFQHHTPHISLLETTP